jgi:hypothetical protein
MCHHKAPHRSWENHPKYDGLHTDDVQVPASFDDDYRHRAAAAAAAKMRIADDLTYLDLGLVQPEGGLEVGEPLLPGMAVRKLPRPADEAALRRLRLTCRRTGEVFRFESERDYTHFKYQRYLKRYLRTIASIDERVGRLLGWLEEIDQARISTIHGFCAALLRTYAVQAGLDPAFGVERGPFRLEDVAAVVVRLHQRIDPADGEVGDRVAEGGGQMGGGVGGGEMHRETAGGEFDRDRGGERRLADPAFAHQHDEAVAGGGDVVNQGGEAGGVAGHGRGGGGVRGRPGEEVAEMRDAHQVEGLERELVGGEGGEFCGQRGEGGLLAAADSGGEGARFGFGGGEDAVDDQVGVGEADFGEFVAGAGHFGKRRSLGAGDQDETGAGGIGQGLDGETVAVALLFEPREGAETGGVAVPFFKEPGPGAGELEEADGVAGGGGVEDDVVVGERVGE